MRILLIYRVDVSELSHSGVLIKMACQKSALEKLGHQVTLVNHDKTNIYQNDEVLTEAKYSKGAQRYFYNYYRFFKTLKKRLVPSDYDLVYIRYPFSTPAFLKFLKNFKSKNPSCKLVLELPTFPYNKEFKGRSGLFMKVDNYCRQRLGKYIDRVVHFGPEEQLLGIPCINVTNGIDVSTFKERTENLRDNTIRLVAIAKWFYWHGLDRILEGLAAYKNQKNNKYRIDLTVVGEGPHLQDIKNHVEEKGLTDLVCFVGVMRGDDLDQVFDQVDIGIGTLGIHRKDLTYNASLKHREFCARGLPFILSTRDYAFDKDLAFVHYCKATDEAIPMNEVVRLFERRIDKKEIRKFASKNLDWSEVMSQVTDSLEVKNV